ncbi:MAG TPA: helix-turn-helix transcriptional regulator [Actinocrinis sp.]|nr:helix-turn-helix transcriptional regulator [Actinocrinis sp.]
MAGGISPLVRGRRLAAILRQLRTASGKTAEEVALHLECSAAKVSRIENGLVGVRIQDARELLDLYGVQGEQRDEILDLVRQARAREWWHPYADIIGTEFARALGFEDEASTIWMLESRFIPGLLQTEDYVTAMLSTRRDQPIEVIERGTRLRMTRQQILSRPEPVTFNVLLDQAALLRRIGPAEMMAGQYRRLVQDAQAPNIRIRVLPLDTAGHQAPGGSFTILAFPDPADPKVVLEYTLENALLYETAEYAGRYTAAYEQAQTCAWDESRSLKYLRQLAEATE